MISTWIIRAALMHVNGWARQDRYYYRLFGWKIKSDKTVQDIFAFHVIFEKNFLLKWKKVLFFQRMPQSERDLNVMEVASCFLKVAFFQIKATKWQVYLNALKKPWENDFMTHNSNRYFILQREAHSCRSEWITEIFICILS